MPKTAKIILCSLPILIVLSLTAAVSYRLGQRDVAERVLHSSTIPEKGSVQTATPDTTSLDTLSNQLNRLTNDYESACANYQTLYEAYDKLYAQTGASSGQEKIVRPDSARGNGVSCYR